MKYKIRAALAGIILTGLGSLSGCASQETSLRQNQQITKEISEEKGFDEATKSVMPGLMRRFFYSLPNSYGNHK